MEKMAQAVGFQEFNIQFNSELYCRRGLQCNTDASNTFRQYKRDRAFPYYVEP